MQVPLQITLRNLPHSPALEELIRRRAEKLDAFRPGVTSWAIVQGRHSLSFEERLDLDVWYVEHWSLALDLRILWMTAGQLLRRRGVAVTQDIDQVGFPIPADTSGIAVNSSVQPTDK